MKKIVISAAVLAMGASAFAAAIEQVIVRQQWPWSTDIKVEYKLSGVTAPVDLTVKAYNGSTELALPDAAVTGDRYGISEDGVGQIVIDPVAAFGTAKIALANFKVKLSVSDSAEDTNEVLYKIFDLTTGEVEDLTRADLLNNRVEGVVRNLQTLIPMSSQTDVLLWAGVTNNNAYRKDKIVMRRVKAGTFTMGSLTTEYGRVSTETNHLVTLTKDYFIGVYEVTQYQYYKITGTWPSIYALAECRNERPVENVSYPTLRGTSKGHTWPTNDTHEVDASSALGKLRAKFSNKYLFDLPTEAQWEMACRAGTTTANYAGENYHKPNPWNYVFPGLACIARYAHTGGANKGWDDAVSASLGLTNGTARVGSFMPNAFGLYDMIGNAAEWCLDWMNKSKAYTSDPVTDPKGCGPTEAYGWTSGTSSDWPHRVYRSGFNDSYTHNDTIELRAAYRRSSSVRGDGQQGLSRTSNTKGNPDGIGFRLCITVE